MIFIDSDVLMDIAMKRRLFYQDSATVLDHANSGLVQIATTPIVLSNVYYLIKSYSDDHSAQGFIKNTLHLCSLLSHSKQDFERAFDSSFSDKEDAVNYFTAKRLDIRLIITRNVKDFKHSEIPVSTPSSFLDTLK